MCLSVGSGGWRIRCDERGSMSTRRRMENTPLFYRWQTLLSEAMGDRPVVDPADAQNKLNRARGQHRSWIVACLNAVCAVRAGHRLELFAPLPEIALPAPASQGSGVAEVVWSAYVQFAMGSSDAGAWLDRATRSLKPTALVAGVDDNPEPWWANELLIMHAMKSFALIRQDAELLESVDRCAGFHVAEIQPDHATNEPWAIHALALHPHGNVTAETLLHAAMVYGGGTLTPIAKLIVADALYAMSNAPRTK